MDTTLEDQPIWGVKSIADEIERSEAATYHLLAKGKLPCKRVGHHWVTTRRKLKAFFNDMPVAK
jgi:hypothetical protein